MTTETDAGQVPAKELVRGILENLPDDASMEDIMYALYLEEKIAQGVRAAEAGEVYTRAEAEAMLAEWRASRGQNPQ